MSTTDNSKLDFIFEFAKNDFSKLELNKRVYSREYFVADVAWKLGIIKRVHKEKHVLGTFVCVKGETKFWCCYARISITILSQKKDEEKISLKFEHLFSSASTCLRYSYLIKWDFLTNPEHGYIKDDTVNFQVHIVADLPQNVDPNYKKVPAEPVISQDRLSVFEDRIIEQIVRRISEEIKMVTSSVEKGSEEIKMVTNSVEKGYEEIKMVTSSVEKGSEEIKTVTSSLEKVSSAVDELKEVLLKKDGENQKETDDDKVKEKNEPNQTQAIQKIDTRIEDTVNKMLDDFKKDVKNDLKKKFLSHHFMYPRTENLTPYGAAPWYGFNEHFTHPYCSHKAKSERRSCGRFNFPFHGSDSHQMLGGSDESDSDSTNSPRNISPELRQISKSRIPNEEEALLKNMDLTKPWKKELLLIGKGDSGEPQIHIASCLKELYELKKKYKDFDVMEAEKVHMS